MTLSRAIETLRLERGWTKKVVSERCRIPYRSLLNLTDGTTLKPTPQTIDRLATGFGVDRDYFIRAAVGSSFGEAIKEYKQLEAGERMEFLRSLGFSESQVRFLKVFHEREFSEDELSYIENFLRLGGRVKKT